MPLLRPDVLEIFRDWRQVSCLCRIFTDVRPIRAVAGLGTSEKATVGGDGWTGRLSNQASATLAQQSAASKQ